MGSGVSSPILSGSVLREVASVKFKKGDTVIYPQHGACIVHGIKRMKAFGATQEYLILKTVINEMTLSVPTAMANQVGVRPPVSKSELEDLRSVLSKADPRVPANWSRRFKNHQEKLKSGDVYQVAEVVRNLAARDRDSALSAAEKTMYDRARINLISEISPALKVSTDAAEVWLDAALEQGVLKPSKGAKIVKQIPKDDAKPVAKAVAKDAAKPVAKAAKVAKVAKVAKAPAKAVAKKK